MNGRRHFQVFLGLLCIVLVSIQIYNDKRNTEMVKTSFTSQDSKTPQNQDSDADKLVRAKYAAKAAGGIFVTKEELDEMVKKLALEEKMRGGARDYFLRRDAVIAPPTNLTTKTNASSGVVPRTTNVTRTTTKGTSSATAAQYKPPINNAKKKVFVCLTGQLQRLILRKKKTHFFQPIVDAGYNIDVALLVTTGTARFTNAWGKTDASEWDTYEEAADYLKQIKGVRVLPRAYFNITEEPDVPMTYLKKLDKENRTLASKMERVRNHARQFEQWTHCYHHFLQNITTTNSPYRAILRFRDDMSFYPQFKFLDAMKIFTALQNNRAMVTCDCRGWNGISDRFAMVTPDIAKPVFLGPHARFSTAIARNDSFMGIHNPETFLYSSYKQLNIKVTVSPKLRLIKKYIYNTTIGGIGLGAREELPQCPYKSVYNKLNPNNTAWYYPENEIIDDFLKKGNYLNKKPSWWPYEL